MPFGRLNSVTLFSKSFRDWARAKQEASANKASRRLIGDSFHFDALEMKSASCVLANLRFTRHDRKEIVVHARSAYDQRLRERGDAYRPRFARRRVPGRGAAYS